MQINSYQNPSFQTMKTQKYQPKAYKVSFGANLTTPAEETILALLKRIPESKLQELEMSRLQEIKDNMHRKNLLGFIIRHIVSPIIDRVRTNPIVENQYFQAMYKKTAADILRRIPDALKQDTKKSGFTVAANILDNISEIANLTNNFNEFAAVHTGYLAALNSLSKAGYRIPEMEIAREGDKFICNNPISKLQIKIKLT